MKEAKPTVSRRAAESSGEDKPVVSRRFAAVALVIIVLLLIFALYLLATGMRASTVNPYVPPAQSPQKQNWTLSPLVSEYGISQTPVLVINCKYILNGSFVPTYSDEMERDNIGQALCAATNDNAFCEKFGRSPKGFRTTSFPECKGNKTLIYAFHSPSCSYSTAQRDVLDNLASEFSSQLSVEYICTPVHTGDMEACSQQFLIGTYSQ